MLKSSSRQDIRYTTIIRLPDYSPNLLLKKKCLGGCITIYVTNPVWIPYLEVNSEAIQLVNVVTLYSTRLAHMILNVEPARWHPYSETVSLYL